ncbi:MAG TPA: PAS domain S-box protein, partial [Thermoplasmatales archaeon]|nr:PAS domain S-box protein [Thermoplasmatales archaeon]
ELVGKTPFDLMLDEEAKRVKQIFERVFSEKKPVVDLESWNLTKDGRMVCLLTNGVPILDETGNLLGYRGVDKDVTERKLMEEKLRENEELLRDFLDNANDLIQSVDCEGRFVYVNKSWLKTLGYTMEEVRGLTVFDILREDQVSHCKELIRRVSEGESFDRVETVFVSKDGLEIFVEGSVNGRFEDGGFVATRAIFRDVTERKRMESRLRDSEERLRALFDATTDMLIIVEEDGTIVDLNDAMAASVGRNKKDLIGRNMREYLPRDVFEKRFARALEVIKTKKPVQFEDERDGRFFYSVLYPIFDENGEIHRIAAFIKDITEEKKIMEALKESEQLFRTLSESSPVGIYIYDPFDEKFVYVNPMLRRLAKAHGIKDVNLLDYLIPESLELVKKRVKERLEGKRVSPQIDVEAVLPDGEKRLVRLHTAFVSYRGRKVVLGVALDLTEEKRMQEKLRESEEKFRTISASAHDAILMMDDRGNISYWNKAAEKMFGYKSDEVIGKDLHMVLAPPRFHESYKKGFKKFKETGRGAAVGKTLELSALRKDGTEFPVELSMSSVKINGRWHAIGIIRDVTERKRMEEKLREAYGKMETLLNAAADGIRIVNRSFMVEALNDTMAELAGVKKEKGVGMRCSDMFGSDVCGTKDCSMVKVLKSGRRVHSRTLRRRIDGKTIPCLHVATPLKDAQGNIVGIIEDFRDITELERVEINLAKAHYRLRHQNERLKRLNNLQKIFLNVTSHELRTPMAAIKGYADLLLLGTLGKLTDEQKEALNVVRRNINRLDNLIKDILDISRLESGTLSIQPMRCDLQEIITEVLATMKFTAETKNISIETKVDDDLP